MKCRILNCSNKHKNNVAKCSFHSFPADDAVAKLWVEFCQQQKPFNLNNSSICRKHFISSEYKNLTQFNMAKLPGDTVMNQDEAMNYPIEFLNSLEPACMPPHCLNLKVGSLIILLRNINPPKLCNGTVKKLLPNLIEATILTAKSKGEVCLIPRIPMMSTDMPFVFKRLQYPVRLSFAMSINKAQVQTLNVCGVNLEESCFSHGQLYVACSRVKHRGKTKNIVYPNVLDSVLK